MRLISLIILCLVAILGITFALLNAKIVTLNYYIGSRDLPLSILLVGTLILGILMGMLLIFPKVMKLKLELHRLRRTLKS